MVFEKDLNDITESDISYLIENRVIENKNLEYKQTIPDNSSSSKNRFLAVIVSFANTSGGLIIFGLKQNKEGEAEEIIGIDSESTDKDFLRLLQFIENGIEQKVLLPDIIELIVEDKKIYLLKVLPSFNKPHRLKDTQKFYGRHSSGRYLLDIEELRNIFLLKESAIEKAERFKVNRLLKIKSSDFPFEFGDQKIIVIHIIPVMAFSGQINLDIKSYDTEINELFPIEVTGHNHIYNYDGKMNYFTNYENKMSAYVQIFRNGIIESVNSGILNFDRDDTIRGSAIENTIRKSIINYLEIIPNLEIGYPMFISISFLNVKGARIYASNNTAMNLHRSVWGDFGGIHNNDILLPIQYIEKKDEVEEKLDRSFDVFWNTDGFPGRPVEK
jgi:hypothetical protein